MEIDTYNLEEEVYAYVLWEQVQAKLLYKVKNALILVCYTTSYSDFKECQTELENS